MNDLPSLKEPMGDWVESALCREKVRAGEAETSWWFPGDKREMRIINNAKKICNQCPVQEDCLAWGIRNEQYGIWGGVGPRQRQYIMSDREKRCGYCHLPFAPLSSKVLYCSSRCIAEAKNHRRREMRKT